MPEEPPGGPPARPPTPPFQDLYATQFKFVWHALWRLGIPNRDLPDLTQRVLVIAFLAWADYDPTRPIKPWLLGIAYRIAVDYHRLARHSYEQLVPTDQLDVVDESTDMDEVMIKRELCALIEKLGRELPPDRRRIFVQHDLEGIPIPEIARSLSIPVNTAYSRLRLARQEIRRRLERHMRQRSSPRGMYFLADSGLRDGLANLLDLAWDFLCLRLPVARAIAKQRWWRFRQGLLRAPRWLARGAIAAAAIAIAGIIPGDPRVAFDPPETASEEAVIPSAQPSASSKPPDGPLPAPRPSSVPAASASVSHQGSYRDAILDTRARLTKRLPAPGQKSPR
jgi:RNA polymerase sigma-70 factor, ECF subfamily